MDQSLFAAPHGLSQRITSFIACACQGIHQMPLFHLIVLIANAHHLVAVLEENEQQTGLPFTTPSTQQCHRRVRHNPIAGTPVHCEVMSLRPASRDQSDTARSGNGNPVVRQMPSIRRQTTTTQSDKLPSYLRSLHHIRERRYQGP